MSGENGNTTTSGDQGGGQQAGATGDQTGSTSTGQQQTTADRTYTQADIDRAAGSARQAERAKYSDYDALKDKASKWDQAEADKGPELDRERNKAREEGRAEATTAGNARLVNAEARAQLAASKAHNPSTAVKALDLSGVKVDKDGNVDVEAVKAVVEAAKTSDAYLFDDGTSTSTGTAQQAGIGAGSTGSTGDRAKNLGAALEKHFSTKK